MEVAIVIFEVIIEFYRDRDFNIFAEPPEKEPEQRVDMLPHHYVIRIVRGTTPDSGGNAFVWWPTAQIICAPGK